MTTTPPADNRIRKAAREYAKMGLRPLPCHPAEKHPHVQWTRYRNNYTYLSLASEFTAEKGLWTMTGRRVGYIVLDCDNDAAVQLWRERLGDDFDRTARVRSRKGVHLWWSVDQDGPPLLGWKVDAKHGKVHDPEAVEREAYYDLQADGQGVMLPPSRHADDPSVVYEWEVLLDATLPAPDVLLASPATRAKAEGGTAGARERDATAKTGRSLLSHLLLNPPDEGGRNNWHSKIAGHFVKVVPYLDAYEALAIALNNSLDKPDDEADVLKTWRYRWNTEREAREAEIGSAESAWLSGSGTELYTVVRVPVGKEEYVLDRRPWANADVIALGVIDSPASGRTYVVKVQRKDGIVHDDMITPGLLGSANDTNKWLAKHGVSVLTPKFEEGGKTGHVGQRILRYLEFQKPDAYRAVQYLGWHRDLGFVTHEGIITANGLRPHEGVMPDPYLVDLAPYHYGMDDMGTAKSILREVLTYQDPQVTAVFGAWWAICFLKGHVVDLWGHFPYFLINAASEAGKTRGFFRLMLALAGSIRFGIGTRASIRDYIGAHRNGIVHIDDPDDVDNLAELLRAAAGEAIISKKGQDNRSTVETKMVAPILLSGESLGLSEEKAQRDRSISIDVPSPIDRVSVRDPLRPQIDDIKDLERNHPDLTVYAGSLVQSALQQASMLRLLPELRGSAGRHNEIKAILRTGARILAGMLHEPSDEQSEGYDAGWIVATVDAWCAEQKDLGHANTLLTRILPWAITDDRWRFTGSAVGAPPVYIDRKGRIWVSVERLAQEWQKECQRRGVRDRLSNEDAIRAQLRAIGATTIVAQWIVRRADIDREGATAQRRMRYVEIPARYTSMILGDVPVDELPEPVRRAVDGSPGYRAQASSTTVDDSDDNGKPPSDYGR